MTPDIYAAIATVWCVAVVGFLVLVDGPPSYFWEYLLAALAGLAAGLFWPLTMLVAAIAIAARALVWIVRGDAA